MAGALRPTRAATTGQIEVCISYQMSSIVALAGTKTKALSIWPINAM
jgi:hypothetical protein